MRIFALIAVFQALTANGSYDGRSPTSSGAPPLLPLSTAERIAADAVCTRSCSNGGMCYRTSSGERCACPHGWTGVSCDNCAQRRVLTASSGSISDTVAGGDYLVSTQCAWLIDVHDNVGIPSPYALELTIHNFTTECSWDHLYIYDGDSGYAPRLAALSGALDQEGTLKRRYIATSGTAFLYFAPDHALNMEGFVVDYKVVGCVLDCGVHGTCVRNSTDHVDNCVCTDGYDGSACEVRLCDEWSANNCYNLSGGNCMPHAEDGIEHCECDISYFHGRNCAVSRKKWTWDNVYRYTDRLPSESLSYGRTAHTMTSVNDTLVIIGGLPMSIHREYVPLVRYNITANAYTSPLGVVDSFTYDPDNDTNSHLLTRFQHSAVFDKLTNTIYIYGGYRADQTSISADLIAYHVRTNRVTLVHPLIGMPLPVAGHTATMVNATCMLVVMGYHKHRSYTNVVQSYDIAANTWRTFTALTDATFSDAHLPLPALYAHTAIWDDYNGRVLIYGGYMAKDTNSGTSSDTLWALTPTTLTFARLSHHRSLFAHSAWVTNQVMIIVGGNGHNETEAVTARTQQCYAQITWAYDMVCDVWHLLPTMNLPTGDGDDTKVIDGAALRRYGHVGVWNEWSGKSYVYGGFNGAMQSDLLVMATGECASILEEGECTAATSFAATKCMWHIANGKCIDFTGAKPPNVLLTDVDGVESNKRQQPSAQPALCPTHKQLQEVNAKHSEPPAHAPLHPHSSLYVGQLKCKDTSDCGQCTTLECTYCNGTCTTTAEQCLPPFRIFAHVNVNHVPVTDTAMCPAVEPSDIACAGATTCHACYGVMHSCLWYNHRCVAKQHILGPKPIHIKTRKPLSLESNSTSQGANITSLCRKSTTCEDYSTCHECTTLDEQSGDELAEAAKCLWCGTLQRCVPINTYVASFTYGQCADWTANYEQCSIYDTIDDCGARKTCSLCQRGQACGWCDDGSATGTGTCMDGGQSGPVTLDTHGTYKGDNATCSVNESWHFVGCPPCQCNGHSSCTNDSNTSMFDNPFLPLRNTHKQPKRKSLLSTDHVVSNEFLTCTACGDNTSGRHCETCAQMFWGDARNGGVCDECTCHDEATTCNAASGACNCNTKGVIGKYCTECDSPYMHVHGNSTCYFELTIDFIFTFSMSDVNDKHVTKINYVSRPMQQDLDVKFEIDCYQMNATVNLSVYSSAFLNEPPIDTGRRLPLPMRYSQSDSLSVTHISEALAVAATTEHTTTWEPMEPSPWRHVIVNQPCNGVTHTFSYKEYDFSREANTSFFVYVEHLQYPVQTLRVTFSQPSPTNWWQFFVIFALVFIGLLVTFFIGWRIKLWWDRRRTRTRIIVEMDRMARRPFATVQLDLHANAIGEVSDIKPLLPKPHTSPSAICVEPTSDYRAAVVTVAVRMPRGGRSYADAGQSGLAVACALVRLPPQHAQALQTVDKSDGDSSDGRHAPTTKSRLKRLRRRAVRSMDGLRSGLSRPTDRPHDAATTDNNVNNVTHNGSA